MTAMRACDDGYPSCRVAEAGGSWCTGPCAAARLAFYTDPQKAYFLDDDSDRLRPCPFCGGDAEFDEIIEGQDTGSHFVQCTSSACGASSARIFPLMDDVKALLLERWNKRHTRLT